MLFCFSLVVRNVITHSRFAVLWERKDEKKALQYAEQVRILFDADWAELLYLLYYCLQLSDYFAIRVFGSMRGTYQGI